MRNKQIKDKKMHIDMTRSTGTDGQVVHHHLFPRKGRGEAFELSTFDAKTSPKSNRRTPPFAIQKVDSKKNVFLVTI